MQMFFMAPELVDVPDSKENPEIKWTCSCGSTSGPGPWSDFEGLIATAHMRGHQGSGDRVELPEGTSVAVVRPEGDRYEGDIIKYVAGKPTIKCWKSGVAVAFLENVDPATITIR